MHRSYIFVFFHLVNAGFFLDFTRVFYILGLGFSADTIRGALIASMTFCNGYTAGPHVFLLKSSLSDLYQAYPPFLAVPLT